MALKIRRKKVMRQTICGRGYCSCRKKEYAHGKGLTDIFNFAKPVIDFVKDNKDTLKSTAEAVGNVVSIADSTKTIVQEIMKKRRKPEDDGLKNIVDKLNQLKTGSGFAYV